MRARGSLPLTSVIAKSATPSLLKSAVTMPSGMLSPLPTVMIEPVKLRALLLITLELFVTGVALSDAASLPVVSLIAALLVAALFVGAV